MPSAWFRKACGCHWAIWLFVLDVALEPGRKLAREDVAVVIANLGERGFHLQRPESVLDPLVAGGVGDG